MNTAQELLEEINKIEESYYSVINHIKDNLAYYYEHNATIPTMIRFNPKIKYLLMKEVFEKKIHFTAEEPVRIFGLKIGKDFNSKHKESLKFYLKRKLYSTDFWTPELEKYKLLKDIKYQILKARLEEYLKALDDVDKLLEVAEGEYVNREMAVYNKLRQRIKELRG